MNEITTNNNKLALTIREQEIINLLLEGNSPKEIAFYLSIAHRTVIFHQSNIYRKLGVNNIQGLFSLYSTPKTVSLISRETARETALLEAREDALQKANKYKRLKSALTAILVILAVSLFTNGYFLSKTNQIKNSEVALSGIQTHSAVNASLVSPENPLVLTLWDNYPYGWFYPYHPVEFKNYKITEGDSFRFNYTFTSDSEFDYLHIIITDCTVLLDEEPYSVWLCPLKTVNKGIIPNLVYSGTAYFNIKKTAASPEPIANQFEIHAGNEDRNIKIERVTLTFTKFELIKISP